MENNIKAFRNTMSVAAFRAANNTEEPIRPVQSKTTFESGELAGKKRCFFALKTPNGNVTGSLSHAYYNGKLTKPVVSEIETTAGEVYLLLHNEGEFTFDGDTTWV